MSITAIVQNDTIKLSVHVPDGTKARIIFETEEGTARGLSGKSAYEVMKSGFGCVSSGMGDLATNKRHLEGLGEWRR